LIYLLAGGVVLILLAWMRQSGPRLRRREWRLLAGAVSLAAFASSAFAAIRGGWSPAVILFLLGAWIASVTRESPGEPKPQPEPTMADHEARQLLGVGPNADRKEILEAYARLIKLAHPDKGGTDGLAAQINAARDRLLGKSGRVS